MLKPRTHPRGWRLANMVLLLAFAVIVLLLGGLVLYLRPDLWVLVNSWLQGSATSA